MKNTSIDDVSLDLGGGVDESQKSLLIVNENCSYCVCATDELLIVKFAMTLLMF